MSRAAIKAKIISTNRKFTIRIGTALSSIYAGFVFVVRKPKSTETYFPSLLY